MFQSDFTKKYCATPLAYCDEGLVVFPCHKSKKPATSHGFKDATKDSYMVEQFFQYEDKLIGIPTGSENGLLVIDFDVNKETGEALGEMAFEEEFGLDVLKECNYIVSTPSGGRHYYFAYPSIGRYGSTAGKLADNVDTRAEGGYIIGAGAGNYNIEKGDISLLSGGLAEVPDVILENLAEQKTSKAPRRSVSQPKVMLSNSERLSRYEEFNLRKDLYVGDKGLVYIETTLAFDFLDTTGYLVQKDNRKIFEGTRNVALFSLAISIRKNFGIEQDTLFVVLEGINNKFCKSPLDVYELDAICANSHNYGTENQRRIEDNKEYTQMILRSIEEKEHNNLIEGLPF